VKTCSKCGIEKELGEFRKEVRGKYGVRSRCKFCETEYFRQYRKDNYEQMRAMDRKNSTGWSATDFEIAWTLQFGKCAICNVNMKPTGTTKDSVSADHCHTTGLKRRLLCRRCNTMIGFAKDQPYILTQAAAYLQSFETPDPSHLL
jgi:recombination endonuclease VII